MMRFSKVDDQGHESEVRILSRGTIAKCPFLIFMPQHYRADGSCKCNDPNEKVMAEWGYVWRDGQWRGE